MVATRRLTLDEFLALGETEPASEFEKGMAVQKPMPTIWHGLIQSLLALYFLPYLKQHNIGVAGSEIRCIFGVGREQRVYVPDYVFIRGSRGLRTGGNVAHDGTPDLAIEILSPEDRASRIRAKTRSYLSHGVQQVWIIDPEDRSITVHHSLHEAVTYIDSDTIDCGSLLPGLPIPVSEILPPSDDIQGGG